MDKGGPRFFLKIVRLYILSAVIFPEYHYLRLANANKGTI